VTVEQIISVLVKNAENAAKVVKATVGSIPKARSCKCGSALAHAILTERDKIPASTKEKLSLILEKYLNP
jgi:5'-methylthioadenosine phosphorylase